MRLMAFLSLLGMCAGCFVLLAACSRDASSSLEDRLERETWAIDNFPVATTAPARSLDTAHGIFDVWEFALHEHYQTPAYGPHWAGAIYATGGGVISVNAAGEFFWFDTATRSFQALNLSYENNRAGLLAYMWPEQTTWPHRFRFTDITSYLRGDGIGLLVSTHYWNVENQCVTLRVIELQVVSLQALRAGTFGSDDWRIVFETEPCLRPDKALQWFGHEGGGALAVVGDDLYVGVGHFGLMGVDSQPAVSQDPDGMYGKVYRVDLGNGRHHRVSVGHRNQQGMVIVDGSLWAVEHGPQGGDELNLIESGENYGWPYVTLGTQYGQETWTIGDQILAEDERRPVSRHFGYAEPVYSWVPSIGVSTLAHISGFTSAWEGDLLAGGLSSRNLHRLRIVANRVQFDEPIRIGSRIRDVTQENGGFVYVLTDENMLLELRPHVSREQAVANQAPAHTLMPGWEGAQAVLAQCGTCHSYDRGVEGTLGPTLYGIVGREVGATGFERHTPEWLALGGVWTEQRLDQLIREPSSVAPRTSIMAAQPPVRDPAIREAMLAYLKSRAPEEPAREQR